jgi:hypothetical protein
MSNLTYESILETMRSLPKSPDNDLLSPFRLRPLGMNLYESPPPPPRIQARDVKLKDGTSVFPAKALAEMNAWLLERFGFAEDMFKDKIYFLGNYGIVASPKHAGMIRNLCS